jgi:hypothetical protein
LESFTPCFWAAKHLAAEKLAETSNSVIPACHGSDLLVILLQVHAPRNLIGRGEASALFGQVREAGLDRPAVAKTVVIA